MTRFGSGEVVQLVTGNSQRCVTGTVVRDQGYPRVLVRRHGRYKYPDVWWKREQLVRESKE